MMKTVELNAIDLRQERNMSVATESNVVALDDLERPVAQAAAPAEPVTFPISINVGANTIREFYPRKHGRVGTRIVYTNGSAQVVREDYAAVKAAFASINN